MQQAAFDPGLTQKYTGALTRAIGENGEFNVRRSGITFRDVHPYLFLVSTSWTAFFGIIFTAFILTNITFASIYVAIGVEHLIGAWAPTSGLRFLNAFFFSTHTLTTIGYGNISPKGPAANALAATEGLLGLMGFAIVTGVVFGRFSRPSARIAFSENLLVAPFGEGVSLQFRIVNRRSNNLLELQARVLLMTVEEVDGKKQRKFSALQLERDQVLFFPLTWTVVHPITPESAMFGKTAEDLERCQAEILVLIKGFDETFGQNVNARHSYRHNEIAWGGRFSPAFEIDQNGDLQLEVDKVSSFEALAPVGRLE